MSSTRASTDSKARYELHRPPLLFEVFFQFAKVTASASFGSLLVLKLWTLLGFTGNHKVLWTFGCGLGALGAPFLSFTREELGLWRIQADGPCKTIHMHVIRPKRVSVTTSRSSLHDFLAYSPTQIAALCILLLGPGTCCWLSISALSLALSPWAADLHISPFWAAKAMLFAPLIGLVLGLLFALIATPFVLVVRRIMRRHQNEPSGADK